MTFRQLDRDGMIAAYVHVWNAEYPEAPKAEPDVRGYFTFLQEDAFEQGWAAEVDGKLVGLVPAVEYEHGTAHNRVEADLLLDPAHEPLFESLIAQFETVASGVDCHQRCVWTHDRTDSRLRLLEAYGYSLAQTVPASLLDIEAFDAEPFHERLRQVESELRFTSIREFEDRGEDWAPALYELTWAIAQDIPSPHPPHRISLEQFRAMVANHATHPPETMFVALEGDRMVGYSRVTPSLVRADLAFTGMSGTLRSHRRRGVVTALKVYGIEAMRRQGIRWVFTDNDETNPMYQINLRLGFRPVWRWVQYVKVTS